MKTLFKTILALALFSFCSCEFSTSSGNKTADNLKTVSESKEPIRNSVTLDEQDGLKVTSTFTNDRWSRMIPKKNTTAFIIRKTGIC